MSDIKRINQLKTVQQEFAALIFIAYTQEQLKTIPQIQLDEMEKVFFAGYKEAWKRITTIVGTMSEEEGEAQVKVTADEINAFFDKVAKANMQT